MNYNHFSKYAPGADSAAHVIGIFFAIIAYSNVSKTKFSLICFFITKNGPVQAEISKFRVSVSFNKKKSKN